VGDAVPAARHSLPHAASCTLLVRLCFTSIRPLRGLLSLSPSFRAVDLLCVVALLYHFEAIRQAKVHLTVQLALLCDLEAIHLLFSHFSLTNLDGYCLATDFFVVLRIVSPVRFGWILRLLGIVPYI
jgi:hypothetical protein